MVIVKLFRMEGQLSLRFQRTVQFREKSSLIASYNLLLSQLPQTQHKPPPCLFRHLFQGVGLLKGSLRPALLPATKLGSVHSS
jgi:hypothetical protein